MKSLVKQVVERGLVTDEYCILHSVGENGKQTTTDVISLDEIRMHFGNWGIRPGKQFVDKKGEYHTVILIVQE